MTTFNMSDICVYLKNFNSNSNIPNTKRNVIENFQNSKKKKISKLTFSKEPKKSQNKTNFTIKIKRKFVKSSSLITGLLGN